MPRNKNKRRRRPRQERRVIQPSPWDDLRATGRTASRALSIFKGAASLLNAEVKHVDTEQSASISTTANLTFLTGISQGDGVTSRDGNSVKLKGGYFDSVWVMHASATATRIRHIVFVDTRNNGTVPSASDIYNTGDSNGLINIDAYPNRFVILHDEYVRLDSASNRVFRSKVQLPAVMDMHLTYSGTGATIASNAGPAIYSLMVSTEATNTPSSAAWFRFYFVDN